jgi:peptidoglycan/LPS O-acetylase OafA/YrhL
MAPRRIGGHRRVKYRREIDGLRAIAVLPVVLFHAGITGFAGGFVGVDVFFVISGYLIATVILTEQRAARFTLARFYERRARRILPALAFVILVTAVCAWWMVLPVDFIDLAQSMMAVSAFASNVLFWKQSGYFDAAESKPLLHTWSLAVEEQFYLIFPLVLLLLARSGKRRVATVLGVGAVASLAVAEWGARHRPVGTFYLLPTRAWELLLGALVALWLLDRESTAGDTPTGTPTGTRSRRGTVAEVAGVVGLALIAASAALYGRTTPFPGLLALAPTVGTALLILFADPRTSVGRMLGSRPLVAIGLISYSVYLWHQPLFALVRLQSVAPPGNGTFLALAALSVALGALTWRYIERPFRDPTRIGRRGIFGFALGSTALIAGLGAIGVASEGFPRRYSLDPAVALTLRRIDRPCVDGPVRGPLEDWSCPLGPQEGEPTFLVAGDSHARALVDAFDQAARTRGVRGVLVTRGACTPFVGIYALRHDQAERNCHAMNESVLAYVRAHHIRTVILVARWSLYTEGGYDGKNLSFIGLTQSARGSKADSRAAFDEGLARTVATYATLGARLIVLAGLPQQQVAVEQAYYKLAGDGSEASTAQLLRVSVPVAEHHRLQRWAAERFARYDGHPGGLQVASLDSLYCGAQVCPIGEARHSLYTDAEHFSTVGALRAVPALAALIPAPPAGSR